MNCYVLTGGESRRMGHDKASLSLGGATFLDRVVAAAAPIFDSVIAVERAGTPDRKNPTIHEREHESRGPLFAIERVLEHAAGNPAWILATDYAALDPAILRFLAERFERTLPPMLVPRTRGELHVLCAGYRGDVLTAVRRHIANGDMRVKGLVAETGGVVVGEEEIERA